MESSPFRSSAPIRGVEAKTWMDRCASISWGKNVGKRYESMELNRHWIGNGNTMGRIRCVLVPLTMI